MVRSRCNVVTSMFSRKHNTWIVMKPHLGHIMFIHKFCEHLRRQHVILCDTCDGHVNNIIEINMCITILKTITLQYMNYTWWLILIFQFINYTRKEVKDCGKCMRDDATSNKQRTTNHTCCNESMALWLILLFILPSNLDHTIIIFSSWIV